MPSMGTLAAPAVPVQTPSNEPINLFQLGCLFVIRASYWSCRISNQPEELELSENDITRRAIASFGTKDLIEPEKGRKVFQAIEKQARHAVARCARPFPAANAHFVPWVHAPALIEQLAALKSQFDQAVEHFLVNYPALRAEWQAQHPEVPDDAYAPSWELQRKFSFSWSTFKVAGAASAEIDVEHELARRGLQDQQLDQLRQNLQTECTQFVTDYVVAFRREVAAFCDQVIEAQGQVHGRTLQAIRRKIDHFHCMNIFNDSDTAAQLSQLKTRMFGVTAEDLAQQPDLAAKLSQACTVLKTEVLDAGSISALTGRLKRRVVLD